MTTRAEAEARERGIKRTCKGLELVDRATQETFMQRILHATANSLPQLSQDISELRASVGLGAGTPALSSPRFLEWCLESIRAHQSDLGKACGRDFNDEVCANPFDGQVRNYTCPACGLTGTYRSPLDELSG